MEKQELTEEQIININKRIDNYEKIKLNHLDNNRPISAQMTEKVITSLKTWL